MKPQFTDMIFAGGCRGTGEVWTVSPVTLQETADVLAARLGRSVTLVDPDIRILCASRHFGDEDGARVSAILQREALPAVYRHIHAHGVRGWTVPGRVAAESQLQFQQRLVIPVRRRGVLLGFMMIIEGDSELTGEELAAAERATALAAELLDHAHDSVDRTRARVNDVLTGLVSARASDRQAALREAPGALGEAAHVGVVRLAVLDPGDEMAGDPPLALQAVLETLRRQHPHRLHAHVQLGQGILFWVSDHEPPVTQLRVLASEAVDMARHRFPGMLCVSGVPRHATEGLSLLWRDFEEAGLALRAASLLPHLRPVACAGELGAYETLLRVPADQLPDVVPAGLRQLIDHDGNGVLQQTLRAYLDHAGSAPATAAELNIHRTSLYYRMRRIEQLTGMELRSGPDRLILHLGVCAVEIEHARGTTMTC